MQSNIYPLLAFVLSTILLASCQTNSNQLSLANDALVKGHYKTAHDFYLIEAEKGNAFAQTQLGILYQFGYEGLAKDNRKAFDWISLAAQQGNTIAQFKMGVFYNNGLSVKRDYVEAAKWYELAVAKGYASAQHNLGILYQLGRGVRRNEERALQLYIDAAGQSNENSQIKLLTKYITVSPNNIDYSKGLTKIVEYARNGNDDAMNALGQMYELGRGVTVDQELSYSWYVKAAFEDMNKFKDKSDAEQLDYIGLLLDGKVRGFEVDLNEALKAFEKKANEGDAEAQYLLALQEEDYTKAMVEREKIALGDKAPVDHGYGIMGTPVYGYPDFYFIDRYVWLTLAFENGYSLAEQALEEQRESSEFESENTINLIYTRLGDKYVDGKAIKQNYGNALEYYHAALDNEFFSVLPKIGKMHEHGQGVELDYQKAISLYRQAIDRDSGDYVAKYHLANMYLEGLGINKDYNRARELFVEVVVETRDDAAFLKLWSIYKNGLGVPANIEKAFMYLYVSQDENWWERKNNALDSSEVLETISEYLSNDEIEQVKQLADTWDSRCYRNNDC